MKLILHNIRKKFTSLDVDWPEVTKPCYLLGSAPQPVGPPSELRDFLPICVNASQASVQRFGITEPYITILNDNMLRHKPVNIEAQKALKHKSVQNLIVVVTRLSIRQILHKLNEIEYRYKNVVFLTKFQRSLLLEKLVGQDLTPPKSESKISTGLFAIFLLRFITEQPIYVDGLSLERDGHSYSDVKYHRRHKKADRAAIDLIDQGVYFLSTP